MTRIYLMHFAYSMPEQSSMGLIPNQTISLDRWYNNIIWVSSLLTFNRLVITGADIPADVRMYLVTVTQMAYVEVATAPIIANDPTNTRTLEWNWDKLYTTYGHRQSSNDLAAVNGEQGSIVALCGSPRTRLYRCVAAPDNLARIVSQWPLLLGYRISTPQSYDHRRHKT